MNATKMLNKFDLKIKKYLKGHETYPTSNTKKMRGVYILLFAGLTRKSWPVRRHQSPGATAANPSRPRGSISFSAPPPHREILRRKCLAVEPCSLAHSIFLQQSTEKSRFCQYLLGKSRQNRWDQRWSLGRPAKLILRLSNCVTLAEKNISSPSPLLL
jgi:hypothetical protein